MFQVEWMSDKIMKTFEGVAYNPFDFRHVKICRNLLELSRIRSPKVCFSLAVIIYVTNANDTGHYGVLIVKTAWRKTTEIDRPKSTVGRQ